MTRNTYEPIFINVNVGYIKLQHSLVHRIKKAPN